MTLPLAAERYLDELTLLLSPADPVDRVEIVTGIREHIAGRLTDEQPDVDAILAELGSPDAVARQTLGEAVPVSSTPVPSTWSPSGVVSALGKDVAVIATVLLLAVALTTVVMRPLTLSHLSDPADGFAWVPLPELHGPEILFTSAAQGAWAWIPGVVLLWSSPRWNGLWKFATTLTPLVPLLSAGLAMDAHASNAVRVAALVLGGLASAPVIIGLARASRTNRAR